MRECSDEWIKLKRKFKTAAAGDDFLQRQFWDGIPWLKCL